MERLTIEVGSYGVNCTLLMDGDKAYIVDPGHEGDRILELLAKRNLTPAAILLTHAHFDHITGIKALQKAHPDLPVYVNFADKPMFGHLMNQLPFEYASIGVPANLKSVDTLNHPAIQIIPTPGHTPGGVCYYLPQEKLLLSGDTLFAGSIGRTDFPGGNMREMMDSLKKLMELPDDTTVVPGHGSETTIARERRSNPYIV